MGDPADALVPSRPNAYGFTDVLVSCSHAVSLNTEIQQPGKVLHLNEQRDTYGFNNVLASCSHAVNPNTGEPQHGYSTPRERVPHVFEQRNAHGVSKLVRT